MPPARRYRPRIAWIVFFVAVLAIDSHLSTRDRLDSLAAALLERPGRARPLSAP